MPEFLNTTLSGRYEIHERLGAGGMARVFRGKDLNLDRQVAIKVLHEHLSDDPEFSERFRREAKLVASLNHPNIVQVFDYSSFEHDGIPIYYMVMPLLLGSTLREQLNRYRDQGKRFPQHYAIRMIEEVGLALGYAHERGMIHRDVKPGNIIIDEHGRAILMDFGIAHMVEATRLTQDSLTTGTPAYMPPEQASGQRGDGRSDLYSLAVILFEMWTGQLPFTDDSPTSLILKHLYAAVPTVTSVTGENSLHMDRFIAKGLAKDPANRFQSAEDFLSALRSIPLPSSPDAISTPYPITTVPAAAPQGIAPELAALSKGPSTSILKQASAGETTRFVNTRFRQLFALVAAALAIPLVLLGVQRLGAGLASSTTANAGDTVDVTEMAVNLNKTGVTVDFSTADRDRTLFPVNGEEGGVERIRDDEAGSYHISNRNFPSAITTLLDSDLPYGNVTLTLVARLDESSARDAGYGIVFRYQDENNYNVFAVDGQGRYSIWVRQGGRWRELEREGQAERWQPNESVRPQDEFNRLRINVTRESLTLFINNQPVTEPVLETTFAYGRVGIYVAAPDSGPADVTVDLFEVYPIIPPMTESGAGA